MKGLTIIYLIYFFLYSCTDQKELNLVFYQAYADIAPKYGIDNVRHITLYYYCKNSKKMSNTEFYNKIKQLQPLTDSTMFRVNSISYNVVKAKSKLENDKLESDEITFVLLTYKINNSINDNYNKTYFFKEFKKYIDIHKSQKVGLSMHNNFTIFLNNDMPESMRNSLIFDGEDYFPRDNFDI